VNKEVSFELIKLLNEDSRFKAINVTPESCLSVKHSLEQRVNKANSSGCDLLLDIHHNAGGGRGAEAYYNNEASKKLAALVLNQVVSIGYKNRGLKTEDFYILKAKLPTILYEGWFVDNKEDSLLYNPLEEAKCIYKGLLDYFNYTANNINTTSNTLYINLHPIRSSWNVYPINVSPVIGNQRGALNPKLYGGLSYKVLEKLQNDVYIIETQIFGRVQIYVPIDNESSISVNKLY
ncbi:N-acetylmuramoyl-L-alanine amidase, partial [Clostridium sp.]|uniref:N-acetylmuramoyl-L-alanine amidase n=1 Tax=Clostridium sp. TaxID=1506 RepID=UPI003F2E09DC